MENDITCNWLLYYSQTQDIINSEIITDIQCNPSTKHQLCSYIAYYNCGKVLFEDYPSISSGFIGLFDYLNKSEWKVMDKMQEDEQRAYIDKLKDYDDFSIKHHTSIIKCLMKSYVCYRAPLDRIKRALEALGVVTSLEDATYVSNYRQLHKHLTIWLKEAAKKGIQRISKFNKDMSDSNMLTIVDRSCLGSLILYTMMYYTQTKMINYKVTLPEVESLSNHLSAKLDISFTHSKIVISAFADICDNKEILPLQIDGLLTKSMDNVPTSLTIALIFHWTFGNSLRNLENLLKSSISSSKLNDGDKIFNQRPNHLPLNDTPKDSRDYKAFFVNSNNSTNCVRPIFNKDKESHNRKFVNGSLTSGKHGEISADLFPTPTEDDLLSFTNSVTPPIKLLSYKTTDNASKINNNNISSDTASPNLKSQFQTKLLQKQNLIKLKPNLNLTTTNETTTWLAQSNKNDIIPIPLTPKKKVKHTESIILSDSQQNLTQTQLNEIQVQLSLRRKKIEEDKKGLVQQTEKNLESSKQKVFFQALNKNSLVVRHKSLELIKDNLSNDTCDGDRRLSMYISRTEKADGGCTIKRLLSNQSMNKDMEVFNSEAENGKPFPKSIVKDVMKEEKTSLNSDLDQTNKVVLKKNNDHNESILISKKSSTTVLLPETSKYNVLDVVSLSRKNSSPSISSLSSLSNISGDKNLVTKDEYEKSIELLSTSLSSLQEELRILRLQQHSWNRQISEPSNTIDDRVDVSKVKSDNNSVVDTPTNTVIALTEVVELPQNIVQSCSSNDVDHYQIESTPTMKIIHNLSYESDKDSPDVAKLEPSQLYISECAIHDKNDDFICQENKINSVESVNTDELKMSPECDRINMTSSSESLTMSSVQPLTFVITDDQNNIDALQKKAELLAKREQRRLTKLEMFRQRREQERENQISVANEELLEKELKKRIEQEKRDSLLQKYLDSKTEEKSPLPVSERRAVSSTTTPVKSAKKSQTPRTNSKSTKPESVENLTLNPKRNSWFSSMRQPNRNTSSSTSVLNSNLTTDNGIKFGVPLPPQEYVGPKLFGKRKVKTNRSVIVNAISHCCLAGSVNVPLKESVLKELAEADGTHFMILFRDSRCQYRSLYLFDLVTEDLNLITGNGPKRITHEMVEKFFKYNSGGKQFNPILSTKHLSTAVDAICIQSIYWNTRPVSQIISGAHSSLSLPRPKRF